MAHMLLFALVVTCPALRPQLPAGGVSRPQTPAARDKKASRALLEEAEERLISYRRHVPADQPVTITTMSDDHNPLLDTVCVFKFRRDRPDPTVDVHSSHWITGTIRARMADDFRFGDLYPQRLEQRSTSQERIAELDREIDVARQDERDAERDARRANGRARSVPVNTGTRCGRPVPSIAELNAAETLREENRVQAEDAFRLAERSRVVGRQARHERDATRRSLGQMQRSFREALDSTRHTIRLRVPEGWTPPRASRRTFDAVMHIREVHCELAPAVPYFVITADLLSTPGLRPMASSALDP